MNTKELIRVLKTKENEELEFIIVTKKGIIVAMDISCNSHDMTKLLSLLPQGKELKPDTIEYRKREIS